MTEAYAQAIYDYRAQRNEELSIKKNEKLRILDDSMGWWRVENESKETGFVPSNYVRKPKTIWKKFTSKKSTDTNGEYCDPADAFGRRAGKPAQGIVSVKYGYVPKREDELELKKGDTVVVLEKEGDGWWRGQVRGHSGWFPSNYVEDPKEQKPVQESPKTPSVLCQVKTLYPFNSGNPEELAFQKDELLDIISQPSDDPDWWEAKKPDGTKGLVPRNYVEVYQKGSEGATQKVMHATPISPTSRTGPPRRQIRPYHQAFPFVEEAWFWGMISRVDTERMLKDYGTDGDFLLRESESKVSS